MFLIPFSSGYKKTIFLLSSVFVLTELVAQEKFIDDLTVSVNYHYGFIIPEYSNFLYLAEKPIQSVSINLAKKTTGRNDWEQIYKYPGYGVSFLYSTLG